MSTHVPDTFYQTYRPRLHRQIARELGLARRVVDIGCGDCTLAGILSKAAQQEVTGVDLNGHGFPRQSGPAPKRRCVEADARSLGFLVRRSVDAVVSVSALHEFAGPMAALREARKILRSGGEILIVDFPRGSLAQRLWSERYYTTGEVGDMLKRAGFVRVESKRIARRQLTWARGFKALKHGSSR